jgi:hypothetical protein
MMCMTASLEGFAIVATARNRLMLWKSGEGAVPEVPDIANSGSRTEYEA